MVSRFAIKRRGATVHLVGEKADHEYIGKYGVPAVSDADFYSIQADDYDAVLVPGDGHRINCADIQKY